MLKIILTNLENSICSLINRIQYIQKGCYSREYKDIAICLHFSFLINFNL